jgi:hypothetical protein
MTDISNGIKRDKSKPSRNNEDDVSVTVRQHQVEQIELLKSQEGIKKLREENLKLATNAVKKAARVENTTKKTRAEANTGKAMADVSIKEP